MPLKEGVKNMTVILDQKLHRQVMVKAAKTGVKITEVVRDYLKRWVNGDESNNS